MVNENENENENNNNNLETNNYKFKLLNEQLSSPISFSFVWLFSWKEICRRKCYFCLCLLSCFIVTIIALVSNTVLSEGPIIFVMMAENNVGQTDFIITPSNVKITPITDPLDNMIFYTSLNYTEFIEIVNYGGQLKKIGDYSSYRLDRSAQVKVCGNCSFNYANLIIINTDKESKMGLGRNYSVTQNKMNEGDCVIHTTLANKLGLLDSKTKTDVNSKGNKLLTLDVSMTDIVTNTLLLQYASKYGKNGSEITDDDIKRFNENTEIIKQFSAFNSTFTCQIINVLDNNFGKTSDNARNTIYMESKFFMKTFSEGINKEILSKFPDFKTVLTEVKINENADYIIVNFDGDRLKNYLVSDFNALLDTGVTFSNKFFFNAHPPENYNFQMPVIDEMQPLFYGAVFFGLILNIIVIILFGLSIILIYSLLLITMETNTFDLALLRLIGNSKSSVLVILLLQCFSFSFPAFLIGYILHFIVLRGISNVFSKISGSEISMHQDAFAIIYAFLLCNLAPLIAAYLPIKSLLSKNLAESLNTNLSKTSGVKVSIVSSVEREQKVLITFGLLTLIYGLSIYYFLPLSLLSLDLSLLLAIFLWILIGMLIGFILLTLNLEHVLQKLFTYAFLFWTKTFTQTIIIKNLVGHRLRNQKTSIMFSLSIGFFIMISVGSNLEISSENLQKLKSKGASIWLYSSGEYYTTSEYISTALEQMKAQGLIEDYSYLTPSLSVLCGTSTSVSNIGKSVSNSVNIYGVSANFYNSTENVFLTMKDPGYQGSIAKSSLPSQWLYAVENDGCVGMSSFFTDKIDLHIDDSFLVFNTNRGSGEFMVLEFKPAYLLDSSPSISMSRTSASRTTRSITVPMNIYSDLLVKCSNFFYGDNSYNPVSLPFDSIPIQEIMIKPKNQNKDTIGKINTIVSFDNEFKVGYWIEANSIDQMNKTKTLITLIFLFVGVVILLFCFFNLSASMTVNMYEQNKEMSIFRSLGITQNYLKWIYVAEAFILIFSASFMGLIVGTILSWTMLIQRIVFTNLPLTFDFPYAELIFILIFALIAAFFSTYFTINRIMKQQISSLMKN